MSTCPKCKNEEHIQYIAKYLVGDELELQLICQNCGNIFREELIFHGR